MCDKAFNVATSLKDGDNQSGLISMVYKSFDKKLSSTSAQSETLRSETLSTLIKFSGSDFKIEIISNKELAEELHKPIIRRFKKRKVHWPSIDNIWGDNLADMELISKFNKRIPFLSCVIDISSKYTWVVPFKDKNCITITNAFQKIMK